MNEYQYHRGFHLTEVAGLAVVIIQADDAKILRLRYYPHPKLFLGRSKGRFEPLKDLERLPSKLRC
jgi:hypothetical protein